MSWKWNEVLDKHTQYTRLEISNILYIRWIMNKENYHTIKDLWIENDLELLEIGEKKFWSRAAFESRLNRKEVPITNFTAPKEMLLKKWVCRRTLQSIINILMSLAEKINQTQGTGRKELLETLKKMSK